MLLARRARISDRSDEGTLRASAANDDDLVPGGSPMPRQRSPAGWAVTILVVAVVWFVAYKYAHIVIF